MFTQDQMVEHAAALAEAAQVATKIKTVKAELAALEAEYAKIMAPVLAPRPEPLAPRPRQTVLMPPAREIKAEIVRALKTAQRPMNIREIADEVSQKIPHAGDEQIINKVRELRDIGFLRAEGNTRATVYSIAEPNPKSHTPVLVNGQVQWVPGGQS